MKIVFAVFVILAGLLLSPTARAQCGVGPASSRVVAGQTAKPYSWPWMVQVINTKYGDSWHWCGASLIHPEWLLTAGHCVKWGKSSDYLFRLAEHDRRVVEGYEQSFRAKKIIMHENYFKPKFLNNDIALVQLDRPALLNKKVGIVCLPGQDFKIPVGTKCYTAGWGLTSGGGKQANVLQEAMMPIVSNARCKTKYPTIPMTKNMVCAGRGGNHPASNCQSDSGGPLMCQTLSGAWKLQGVVSWGHSMCQAGYYSAYARVPKYRNWIKKHTGI